MEIPSVGVRLRQMLRPPKNFDPARACPLILLPSGVLIAWEALADREHAILAEISGPPTVETVRQNRDSVARRFAVDRERVFLLGAEAGSCTAEVSASTPQTSPDCWSELERSARAFAPPKLTRLSVSIQGIRSPKGKILATLYRSEKSFGKPAEAQVAQASVTLEKTATLLFSDSHAGEMALLLFHDENDNGKLDTGIFGIPKEGYGASNDPKMRMGPPRWRETRFLLTGVGSERELSIRLRYP
jgi:uncharacterized protein (DUF2141 family)